MAREFPRELDAVSTFVLVFVTLVLTPAIDEPSEVEAPRTVPLTVCI